MIKINCGYSAIEEGKHIDKIAIINKMYSFRNTAETIDFVGIGMYLINRVSTVDEEMKNYFIEIFSIIKNIRPLYIENFKKVKNNFNAKEYLTILKNVKKEINNNKVLKSNINMDNKIFKFFNVEEKSKEDFDKIVESESFNEIIYKTKNIKKGKVAIECSELIKEQYNEHLGLIIYKDEDMYDSMFKDFVNNLACLRLSRTCYAYDNSITEEGIHVDIACMFNLLLETIIYLKNSTSFRNQNLYYFDTMEFENNIFVAKKCLDIAIKRLERRV